MGRDPRKTPGSSGEVFQLPGESRGQAAHVLLPAPLCFSIASPSLGPPANEKEKKNTLLCVEAKPGEGKGREKKKDNMWVVCWGDF